MQHCNVAMLHIDYRATTMIHSGRFKILILNLFQVTNNYLNMTTTSTCENLFVYIIGWIKLCTLFLKFFDIRDVKNLSSFLNFFKNWHKY